MKEQAAAIQKEKSGLKLVGADELLNRMKDTFDAIERRAFEIFEGSGRRFGHDLEDWFRAETELLHPVHINISEMEGALQVKAEVPGFTEKELEVNVEPRRLTITGKRETKEERKQGKTVYCEHCADQILRVVELPAEVDTAKVTTTLKDGVLEFVLPEAAPAEEGADRH